MSHTGSFRGGIPVGGTLYAAFTNALYTVDITGVITLFDNLPGTDQIYIARNQNVTPDVVVVCNDGPFYVNILGGTVDTYPDGDVGSPVCVAYHDGYFFFGYGDGDILASGLNATTINTLDVANAASNPDGVVELWSYGGQLYVAGEKTIEIWGYPVNDTGFPLTRVGYHITPGLIAQHAVAGFEPEFGNPPIYVGSDNTVRWVRGYTAEKISPPVLDRLIDAIEDKNELKAMVYQASGHAFWQLSCNAWTWVFNVNNQKWHERKSYLQDRSRFTGGSVYAFDRWLTGDTESNSILEVTTSSQEEVGDPLIASIESATVKNFPNRVRVPRADFDFAVGVGIVTGTDPMQTDPSILVSWSDDGGVFFKEPYTRKLGRQAKSQQRITVLNTGMTGPMGRRWRLSVSDAVDFALLGGDMSMEVRQK